MKQHPLTQILEQTASEAIPAKNDLRAAVFRRLETGKTPQGNLAMKKRFAQRNYRIAALAAGVVLLLVVFLATPQGQAATQTLVGYFRPAESDVLPQPVPTGESGIQPTPTTISATDCGSFGSPLCTLDEVRNRVDYPVKQIALGQGLTFKGAFVQKGLVVLHYDPGVVLTQEPVNEAPEIPWEVGTSAQVEEVQIGPARGEYVQGVWQADADDPFAEWQNEGLQTLIWEHEGIRFRLLVLGNPAEKEQMLTWAAGLTVTEMTSEPDLSNIREVSEAEALVGYAIRSLNPIPDGYIFTHASIHAETKSVCLHYMYTRNDGPGPYLLLGQGPADQTPGLVHGEGGQNEEPIAVTIGGAEQAFALQPFGWARESKWACASADTESNYDRAYLTLTWQAAGQQYDLYTSAIGSKCMMAEALSDLDRVQLAEGVTGVSTHAADEFDPACTMDVAQLSGYLGYPVQAPGWLPDGLALRGASGWGNTRSAMLYYGYPGDIHAALTILQEPIADPVGTDLLELVEERMATPEGEAIPADGYERVEINGSEGILMLGSWVSEEDGTVRWYQSPGFIPTLYWQKDGLLVTLGGPWSLEEGDEVRSNLLRIAESMN